ncbi:aldehyde dehydrogenase 1A1-like [Dendroctonus ponderosae]|uniref:aldehyde dehydrogenase 1A1 n=1 Tax=Dendroctonus ponderosae TaxID=77166 RepID=UPI0020352640|nr:aldehyde dehydrogenase 1A1 [Dendroctonus ponderosae]XP_048521993.1 aldehyde dehydrogenase 1A1-like [Dendroctonus ponderosae]
MAKNALIKINYTKLFINNEFVDSLSKKTFPVINPVDGEAIANVAEAQKEDVDLAVAAAKKAFARKSPWRNLDASDRGKLLNKFADLLDRDTKELAELETLNSGKPLAAVIGELEVYTKILRYYGGYCDKIHGNTIPIDGNGFCLTRKEPVGVVAQIIPWNYPIGMAIWKLGPALCSGCTLILKPAEQTPLTALALAALTKEAGFPDGVVNVLPGYGPITGEALCLHNDVRKVAFTGSTDIGHKILEYSAKSNLKRVSLELGGKSPLVIFDDADIDEAVEIAHNAIFENHGQNCCAGSRTFVQAAIYDEFVKKAVEKAKARKVGDPFEAGVLQGPQIDQPSVDKILRIVEESKQQGARLETGGARIGDKGFFVQPTVFSGVSDKMSCAVNEIFGPVQTILKFDTIEEVIERANNTAYGLAGGVITKNINNALVFANAVEAGSVWINCYDYITAQTPFGGVKKSGFGKDLGADSLDDYLETKTINIMLPVKN